MKSEQVIKERLNAAKQEIELSPHVTEKTFDSREEVIGWIIDNQLGRRNLTLEQKNYLIGKKYKREKKQGARTDLTSGQNDQKLDTSEKIAEEQKVAPKTVRNAEKFTDAIDTIAEAVGDEVKENILRRDIPATMREV